MYCISCGVEIPENTAFCTECGTQQNASVNDVPRQLPAMQPVSREKKSVVAPFVCVILSLTVFRSIVGVVLSIIGLSGANNILKSGCQDAVYDMAKATKILAIISLVMNIISIVAYIAMVIIEFLLITSGLFEGFANGFQGFPMI